MRRFATYYLPLAALVVLVTLGVGLILSQAELDKLKVYESSYLVMGKEVLFNALKPPLDHLRGLDQEPQVKQALRSPEAQGRSLMEQQLLTLLYRNPSYDQARWLSAAGREIARVNNTPDGPVIVPEADLQDKSARHYYQQGIGLAPGRLYLSPLDLSVEYGEVEIPYRPMVRHVIRLPVVDGRDQGLLVIDLLAQPLLDYLRRLAVAGHERQAMLLNPQGYWLLAPDPEDAWGFNLGRDTRLGKGHPAEWARMQAQTAGQILTPSGLWSWTRVSPAELEPEDLRVAEDWTLVSYISAKELWDLQWRHWWPLLLTLATALVLLALGVRLYLKLLLARQTSEAELDRLQQERLAAELDRMRLLMQEAERIAQLGAWEYNVATQETIWSEGECRIYGLDPSQPSPDYGAMLRRCIHPDDVQRLDEVFGAALAAGAPFELEHRILRPDGSERLVRDLAYPARDDQGRLVKYVGATLDITERMQAQEALAATTLYLQALLDALPVAVGFTDGLDVGHIQANRTFRKWFEMAPDAEVSASAPDATAPGRQVRYFHAGQELEADALPLQRALSEGRPTEALELEIALPSGRRWIAEITAVPIRDAGGEVIGGLAVLVDITVRKQAEEALRRSEARLRLVTEGADLGIWYWDLATQTLEWSERCKVHLGLPPGQEPSFDRFYAAVHPDDRARIVGLIQRAMDERTPDYQAEYRVFRADGSLHWVSAPGRVYTHPDGGPSGMGGITQDITQRKQAEAELSDLNATLEQKVATRTAELEAARDELAQALKRMAHSEARFRTMFEQAPLGIALVDSLTGQISAVNPRFAAIAGRSQEEMASLDWMSITHPDDIQPDLDKMARLNAGEIPGFQMNKRFLRPDGTLVWISLTIAPMTREPGQGPRHLSMIEDITERVAAERRIRETLGLLQVASQIANIGVWHWEIINNKLDWDDRLRGWYEVPEETGPGDLNYDFWRGRVHPDDRGPAEEALAVALRDQTTYEQVFRILPPSGQVRYLQASALIERDANGQPARLIGVNRDITAQRELEEGLRAAKEAAETANRAKSAFLAHMSHEIRTPLHAVLGLAQVLEKSTLAADQRAMVQQVRTAGGTLLGILNDILDLSKIEAGRLELVTQPFALGPLLSHIDSLLGPTARAKGLKLMIDAAPTELKGGLLGDALRLVQVLVNLVGNAIKFTDQGEVRVRSAALEQTAERARLRFAVSDTGIGLTAEALAGLFTPFTQADASITRRFGGTGLGLTISKRLVELMGGAIGAESQVGVGSTFWFELTLARTTVEEERPSAVRSGTIPAGPRLAGLHLLVVDDSPLNGEVVERMLNLEGALATLAENGQQALNRLRTQPQAFDAVLMDVQMPVMDGLTATRQIRASLGLTALPIIALTAGVLPEEQAAARAAGVNAVLSKPLDLEEMVAMLRQWVVPKSLPATPPPPAPLAGEGREEALFASLPSGAKKGGMSSLLPGGGGPGRGGETGPNDFPAIPGIDRVCAARTLCQDRAFFLRLLALFLDESVPLVALAREALAQGDREGASRRLHSLKGNAGNIGAMAIMALAGQLERAIDQGATTLTADGGERAIASGLADLERQVAALAAASAPWLAPAAVGSSPVTPVPVTPAPVAAEAPTSAPPLAAEVPLAAPSLDLGRLAELYEALRRHRLQARKLFQELEPALQAVLGKAQVQTLAAAIANLRFDDALTLLEERTLMTPPTSPAQEDARR